MPWVFISAPGCLRDFGNIHSAFDLLSVLEKAAFVLFMERLWTKLPVECKAGAEAGRAALLEEEELGQGLGTVSSGLRSEILDRFVSVASGFPSAHTLRAGSEQVWKRSVMLRHLMKNCHA